MTKAKMSSDKANTDLSASPSNDDDWFLGSIVTLLDKVDGFDFGVTLSVGGRIVAGNLISGRQYFTELGLSLSQAADKQTTAAAADIMRTFADNWSQLAAVYDPSRFEDSAPAPSFIHLKNARYIIGSDFVPAPGMLWRGKLSSVDGFSLGALTRG